MADGPTLRPKSTGQQQLPCPIMNWTDHSRDRHPYGRRTFVEGWTLR